MVTGAEETADEAADAAADHCAPQRILLGEENAVNAGLGDAAESGDACADCNGLVFCALCDESNSKACAADCNVCGSHTGADQRIGADFSKEQEQNGIGCVVHAEEYEPAGACADDGNCKCGNCAVDCENAGCDPGTDKVADGTEEHDGYGCRRDRR